MTHDLDLAAVTGIGNEGGKPVLRLPQSLWIRAVDGAAAGDPAEAAARLSARSTFRRSTPTKRS